MSGAGVVAGFNTFAVVPSKKNPTEKSTKAILEFNKLLYNSPDLFTTILPIRDGVAVAIKK